MIRVSKLLKRFGLKAILRGVELEVQEGEFLGLLGPNGAGKTTFLRILASLSKPTAGLVEVGGYQLPKQAAQVRRQLGVLSHQPLLYGDLSAEENLKFFGRMYAVDGLHDRIGEVLDTVGLNPRRKDLVRTFSRGMQQRLAIARAIIHDPDILLLDEPYTGLDQDACAMLDELMLEIAGNGRTVVMTSHDLSRAADVCSRFVVLANGKIVASQTREEIPTGGLLTFYKDTITANTKKKKEAANEKK